MARKGKDSFIMYYQFHEQFTELSDEEAGALIKMVFAYEINGEEPTFEQLPRDSCRLLKSMFLNIKKGLDLNKIKYEEVCDKRKAAADLKWGNITDDDSGSINKVYANVSQSIQMHAIDTDTEKKGEGKRERNRQDTERGLGEGIKTKKLQEENNQPVVSFGEITFTNEEYEILKSKYGTAVLGEHIEQLAEIKCDAIWESDFVALVEMFGDEDIA